jgi:uncharacterized protein YgiM (DUF1202 family)
MALKPFRNIILSSCAFLLAINCSLAQEIFPFQGRINSNNINIRSDSRVTSETICSVSKEDTVDVISELYGWYKIRLPKNAPSYIKKSFAECRSYVKQEQPGGIQNCTDAKLTGNNVNIRLRPDEKSPILGKLKKDEIVAIRSESALWYQIEPVHNSFGWVNKKFVDRQPANNISASAVKAQGVKGIVSAEGMVYPYGMVIKRKGTHKLITPEKKIFLIRWNKSALDDLNYHKAKVTGKIVPSPRDKYPVIEIESLEVKD